MTAKKTDSDAAPEPDTTPDAAAVLEAATAADAEQRRLAVAPVGSVRPADGLEARVDRLEALLRSQHGIAVLTPEDAKAAAKVQDDAAKDES